MNNKERAILQNLLKLYVDMYPAKDLFNKLYFKYSPEDVEKTINSLQQKEKPSSQNRKTKIKDEISSIKSEHQVLSYYMKNLQYNRNDKKSKDTCLKKVTLEELKYLYKILYTSPLRKNTRKNEILDLIEKYFASIDRARNLKP